MSGRGDGEEKRPATPALAYGETFERLFPFYLSIGMSPNEYWNGDCTLTRAYWKAAEMKRDMDNQQAWLSGLYTLAALKSALSGAFGSGRSKVVEYPDKPIPLTAEQAQEQEGQKEEEAMNRALEMFKLSVGEHNRQREKAGDKNG